MGIRNRHSRAGKDNIVGSVKRFLYNRVNSSERVKAMIVLDVSLRHLQTSMEKSRILNRLIQELEYSIKWIQQEAVKLTRAEKNEKKSRKKKEKRSKARASRKRRQKMKTYDEYITREIGNLDDFILNRKDTVKCDLKDIIGNLKRIFNNSIVKQKFIDEYAKKPDKIKAIMGTFKIYCN